MMRKPAVVMAERREGKPLVEIAAREHGTFFKFIRVPLAGEMNIKINVQSQWKEWGIEKRERKNDSR